MERGRSTDREVTVSPIFWKGLIEQNKPDEIIADHLLTHEFICEILDHLNPVCEGFAGIMEDPQPGWDDKRKIFGKLFPSDVSMTFFPGLRHDSDLIAETLEP
jgi:hypothetical protein